MSPLLSSFPFVQGGGGGTPKATVTGTTGSPTVDTSSRPGKTIYKFTGSGSITVGVEGSCEVLCVGGGGSTSAGGNASSGVSGTAGAGTANSITGSSVTYAAGRVGDSGTSGGANTGDGGGGNGGTPTGGSGFVVVVIG